MPKKVYRTAIYCRLSREDGDKIESNSIASQRAICGNTASRKTRNIMAKKKGITLRKMLAMGTSVATLLRAKTLMPTGGVICPASMRMTTRRPSPSPNR